MGMADPKSLASDLNDPNEEEEESGFEAPKSLYKHDSDGNLVDADGMRIAWTDTKPWISFFIALLYYFILSLLIGLFGSGFIYLTTRGGVLDYILPTYNAFYKVKSYDIDKKGPYTDVNCVEVSMGTTQSIEENFPYNLIVTDENGKEYSDPQCKYRQAKLSKDPDFKQKYTLPVTAHISDWFAQITRSCFMRHREWLKTYLSVFEPDSPFGNHAFQICIAFPFTFGISVVSIISGAVTAIGASFGTGHFKLPLFGVFFMYLIFVGLAMGGILYLRLLMTICILPLMQNWKEVANIMSCNVKTIAVVFGYFVCGAAYENLDSTISGIMAIVFLLIVVHIIYKHFKGKK
jgi:hypothetical protein